MTIRRRLFISNILMIAVPLVVSIAVFYAGLFIFTSATGVRDNRRFRDGERFQAAAARLSDMAEGWRAIEGGPSFDAIVGDVERFNTDERNGRWPLLLVFRDGWLVWPEQRPYYDSPMASAARASSGTMIASGMTSFTETAGEWRVVLVDPWTHVFDGSPSYRDIMRYGSVLAIVCSIFIILFTNRFLTRFIFRGIVDSLDTLTGGVRELRDGNLGYRIDYRRADEFAPVCAAFNDMASQLQGSIEARARDEASRRELIAGISHDLRTPLTSIKAYVEGIQQGVADDEAKRDRYLATIRAKADDLSHIIDMLFLFAKLDTDGFPYAIERLDASAFAAEAIEAMRDEWAKRGIAFTASIESDEGAYVMVDAVQLRSVIANIVDNSVKYADARELRFAVSIRSRGGEVVISIADNGVGVPAEALGSLFDLFYRDDPARSSSRRGSGLGLAISKKIITHFGGTIKASLADGGGLRIVIALPAADTV